MAAIVLAGGKSRRMGTDKALLPWEGKTLLEHAVSIVSQIEGRVIVVADIADKYSIPGVERVVGDEFPDTRPLGAILTGLNCVEGGYHYALVWATPYALPEILQLP